jgi:2-polyprenyl-3-methyl-5-hydroxy-6-metoxy-1,4-benzoquinol methylase
MLFYNIFDMQELFADDLEQLNSVVKAYVASDKNLELEVSFLQNEYYRFIRLMKKMIDITDEDDISSSSNLDIQVPITENDSVRVTVSGDDNINHVVSTYSLKPNNLVPYLESQQTSDFITVLQKDRSQQVKHIMKNIYIVVRLTPEIKLKQIPLSVHSNDSGKNKLYYRHKERVSFIVNKKFSLDMTIVRDNNHLSRLFNQSPHYEIELEVIDRKVTATELANTIYYIKMLLEDTFIPISADAQKVVIQNYFQLLGINKAHHLSVRYASSLEVSHLVDLPSKYGVTDKADGERYVLFISQGDVHLISNNLHVKKTPLRVEDKKYHNALIDGELIEIEEKRVFLPFDIIYLQTIGDFRFNEKYTLTIRLRYLNDLLANVFNQKFFIKNYLDDNKDFDENLIEKFYSKEIASYWSQFNKDLDTIKSDSLLVRGKIYFTPYGASMSEVFLYSKILWDNYNYKKLAPYMLDGLVYTPLNYPYMISSHSSNTGARTSNSNLTELKWKPARQNSIDFFIRFERDTNNNISLFFNNNDPTIEATKSYRICHLYVGSTQSGVGERPVPFRVNGVEQRAYLYLDQGQVRDLNDDVIEDETVVEFIYDMSLDETIKSVHRWIPIRTRYDKTESVMKYQKKYGNEMHIASRIWKSINNPITLDNIYSLSKSESFDTEFNRLTKSAPINRNPKSHSTALINKKLSYYQKTTDLALNMRAFHNWIKNNIIQTYCFNATAVLDIGCGRGGDINKFIAANVKHYVGLDIDYSGLYQSQDSAINRYNSLKLSADRRNANITDMHFIQADANALFDVSSQTQVIPNMSQENKTLIETYLSKRYDVINCQFAVHYFLANTTTWNNFISNVDANLSDNGYVLITTLDGDLIKDRLKSKAKLNLSYTTNTGEKRTFVEMVKVFADDTVDPLGLAIDLYNSMISNEGVYNREYLVLNDFIVSSMEKYDLQLVSSDNFERVYDGNRTLFLEGRNENLSDFVKILDPANKDKYSTEDIEFARASFEYSKLNKYYVFQRGGVKKATKSKAAAMGSIEPMGLVKPSKPKNVPFDIINTLSLSVPKWKYKTYLDPAFNASNANETYHRLKDTFKWTIVPNVYLIRHKAQSVEIVEIKKTDDTKAVVIYKSLEKEFMPVYFTNKAGDAEFLFTNTDIANLI